MYTCVRYFVRVDEPIGFRAANSSTQQRQALTGFSKDRPPDIRGSALVLGQPVRVHVSNKWIQGKVNKICKQPHSYVVRTRDGREFRRTRRAINIDQTSLLEFPTTVLNPVAAPSASDIPVQPLVYENNGQTSPSQSQGSPFHGFKPQIPVIPLQADSSSTNQAATFNRGSTRSGRHYLAPPGRLFN
jgi:hypothetical protein